MLSPPFYVISDTHFFHDNIVKFCGRDKQLEWLIGPDEAERIDHNEYMVQKWNEVVQPGDPVLHLGDVGFGKNPWQTEQMVKRLNGDKYLLYGNHDKPIRKNPSKNPSKNPDHVDGQRSQDSRGRFDYEAMGFTVLEPFEIQYRDWAVSFNHYPEDPGVLSRAGKHIRVHGHIHNNGYPSQPGEGGWRFGTTTTSPCQINVSVEEIDYTPQSITKLLDEMIDA